jgi:hypothetical protein
MNNKEIVNKKKNLQDKIIYIKNKKQHIIKKNQ